MLRQAVEKSPTFLREFQLSSGNIYLPDLYEIAWELEKEGEIICLDFVKQGGLNEKGDTICFNAGTVVIQPGLRVFFPKEQRLINALLENGIMGPNDLSLLSGDNRILFVRTISVELAKNPADIKFEYNRWLMEFMNREPPIEE